MTISMTRLLAVLGGACFAASLFGRIADPLIPQIAADFAVAEQSAALLGTAFALPWALAQPILGPVSDRVGKPLVITVALAVLVATAIVSAMATSFSVLLAARIVAGAAAAGIFPISIALVGDQVPLHERHVALGRIVAIGISGQVLGATVAGALGDLAGWRSAFLGGALCAAAGLAAVLTLRRRIGPVSSPPRLDPRSVLANYRRILADPVAKVCYGAVFVEGVVVFGLFPYIAVLLVATGENRASIAGLVVGSSAVGGIAFLLSVRPLLNRFGPKLLMLAGGLVCAAGLLAVGATPPWQAQMAGMFAIGFGFYMLHNGIQVQMTELAPETRGAAVALHSCAFFLGQALGPIAYGAGFVQFGSAVTIVIGAAAVTLVGILCAHFLHSRPAAT